MVILLGGSTLRFPRSGVIQSGVPVDVGQRDPQGAIEIHDVAWLWDFCSWQLCGYLMLLKPLENNETSLIDDLEGVHLIPSGSNNKYPRMGPPKRNRSNTKPGFLLTFFVVFNPMTFQRRASKRAAFRRHRVAQDDDSRDQHPCLCRRGLGRPCRDLATQQSDHPVQRCHSSTWAVLIGGVGVLGCPGGKCWMVFLHLAFEVWTGQPGIGFLVVWNIFSHILGMSSSQLTNSIIFQRGRAQPPTRFVRVPHCSASRNHGGFLSSCAAGGQTMGPHTMGRYRTNAKTHDLSCTTPAARMNQSQWCGFVQSNKLWSTKKRHMDFRWFSSSFIFS